MEQGFVFNDDSMHAGRHYFSKAAGMAGLVAVLLASGCSGPPSVTHRAVPESVIRRLNFAPAAQGERALQALTPSSYARGPVTVPMKFLYGLPVVDVRINQGDSVPLLVDTGSEVNVLEARVALSRKVRVLPVSRLSTTIVGTLGSERALVGAPETLDIGPWQLRNIPCVVRTYENHLIVSPFEHHNIGFNVLGMDLLTHACRYLTLDYAARQVTFGIGQTFPKPAGQRAWSAPLSFREGIPYVTLHADGQKWTAMVDTGYNGLVEIDKKTATRLDLLGDSVTSRVTRVGVGSSTDGRESDLRAVMLPGFESLGPQMINIPAAIVPDRSKIGTGLLRPFRVTLDFKRRLLWLEDPAANASVSR